MRSGATPRQLCLLPERAAAVAAGSGLAGSFGRWPVPTPSSTQAAAPINVAVRVGSQVTIVHRGARPLSQFDPDLVDQLVAKSPELGIDVQLGAEAEEIENKSGQFLVHASTSSKFMP